MASLLARDSKSLSENPDLNEVHIEIELARIAWFGGECFIAVIFEIVAHMSPVSVSTFASRVLKL